MKVLVVCDEGNNRSVTIAGQLKYWYHDVLTAGLARNSPETIKMLCDWADRIIITHTNQPIPPDFSEKVQLWNLGPDTYPRPFNPNLLQKVRTLMQEHRDEYRNDSHDE